MVYSKEPYDYFYEKVLSLNIHQTQNESSSENGFISRDRDIRILGLTRICVM